MCTSSLYTLKMAVWTWVIADDGSADCRRRTADAEGSGRRRSRRADGQRLGRGGAAADDVPDERTDDVLGVTEPGLAEDQSCKARHETTDGSSRVRRRVSDRWKRDVVYAAGLVGCQPFCY
ncbi:hypothetical protein D1007_10448 [Hordeum vulgare]|nr:hypothetical protein D1007_10448 [Hordeum vulgare]